MITGKPKRLEDGPLHVWLEDGYDEGVVHLRMGTDKGGDWNTIVLLREKERTVQILDENLIDYNFTREED